MRRNWHEQVHHGTGGHVLPGIHDRLHGSGKRSGCAGTFGYRVGADDHGLRRRTHLGRALQPRSEEHTSELHSPYDLVCRLLLEKKKKNTRQVIIIKKKKKKKKIIKFT